MPDESPVPGDGFNDDPVDKPGEEEMEPNNLTIALTSLGNEFGAAAAARVRSADQLAGDSQRMWTIAMTTPSVMAGMGYRTMVESGSGRTRAETNQPGNTAAP